MARGGRRQGSPGQGYSNRTDLIVNRAPAGPPAAPTAAPQQRALLPQQGAVSQPAQPTPTAAPATAPPIPQPGSLGSLLPTQRPGEPLTHGLPTGPGGGPEVLAPRPFQPDPLVQASALLSSLPSVHQTPAIKALAAAVGASMANGTQTSIVQGG